MAEGEDDSQKTEEPTPKKLEDSRKKGQLPLSREVNHWFMLLAATMVITLGAGPIFGGVAEIMRVYVENAHSFQGTGGVSMALSNALFGTLKALALPLLGLMFIAFIGPFGQVGPLFAPEVIKPDLSKVSIIKGFERLFSPRSLMEFAKGIFKIAMVGIVGVIIISPYFPNFEKFIDMDLMTMLIELQAMALKVMIAVLVIVFVIAVADLTFQQQQHHQKMKMSRQEVKDEYKQSEGDPHVRAKLRQLRSEKARARMMQAVPEADVVITNPTHYAIALKYDPDEMPAPLCIAKGVDETALRIRELARESGVEVVENKPLARALFDVVDLDESIPTEYFKAVAEIISFVFKKQGRLPQGS